MKDESLEKSLDTILLAMDKLDIDIVDKVEILLNLRNYLDPKTYRDNTDLLEKERIKRKYRNI